MLCVGPLEFYRDDIGILKGLVDLEIDMDVDLDVDIDSKKLDYGPGTI